jgi:Telomerase ribonucleoprotein complex - RNA binding domain
LVACTVDDIIKDIFPWELLGRHSSLPALSVAVIQKRIDRLKPVQELVCKLVKNYRKCNILALLDCYCPIDKFNLKAPQSKADIVGYQTPIKDVIGFIRAVLRHIVPVQMFGDLKNFNAFLKNIDRLLKIRKFEALNLELFLDSVKVLSIVNIG